MIVYFQNAKAVIHQEYLEVLAAYQTVLARVDSTSAT
jgi:hypothetical protein